MIEKSCMCFDGDDDCNKCVKHGIIYSCPVPCHDYLDFFGRNSQEKHWFEAALERDREDGR